MVQVSLQSEVPASLAILTALNVQATLTNVLPVFLDLFLILKVVHAYLKLNAHMVKTLVKEFV